MRYVLTSILAAASAVGGLMWYQQTKNEMPSDHISTLTEEEYRNSTLREKDCIKRMTPRMGKELGELGLKLGDPVFVRIFKEERELEIWVKHPSSGEFLHFKTWIIAAMSGDLGPKTAEGDFQAPEGFYYVKPEQMRPDSNYHLAINVGYPNSYDKSHSRTGSFIMIHGKRASAGCFAMTDPSVEEIYTLCEMALRNGQRFFRIHSFPFRMNTERMTQAREDEWYDFWQNLKEGYDYFEKKKTPPNVKVVGKRYVFE